MNIEARFHIRKGDFALDASLEIPIRGVTGLFGPSGSGKTTLLRAIAGLDYIPNGFLKFGEMIWQDRQVFVPAHKRRLGYVFQEASLFDHFSVRKNLEYGQKRVPVRENQVSLSESIDLLGIAPLLRRKPETLSGGERQRVAIARALAASPKILLMDEPLSGLDQASRNEILPYLDSLHNELNIPVIYVSHILEEMIRLADHLILLDAGQIVAAGRAQQVLSDLDVSSRLSSEAAAIIDAEVIGSDEDFHLSLLQFSGGILKLAAGSLKKGDRVRLKLAARDVSLTLEHQSGTSILNIFPAKVEEINPESDTQVMVRLVAGSTSILSRITRKSAFDLELKPGKQVFAQVKSVALIG
jgi:molybdate transport system ATP-binding protein